MKIEFGTARRIINPEVPISLAGYFNLRMWDHVKDDLEVRAVVFKKGPDHAAILHFDLLCMPLYLCDAILTAIQKKGLFQFNRKNVTLCATHTILLRKSGSDRGIIRNMFRFWQKRLLKLSKKPPGHYSRGNFFKD